MPREKKRADNVGSPRSRSRLGQIEQDKMTANRVIQIDDYRS